MFPYCSDVIISFRVLFLQIIAEAKKKSERHLRERRNKLELEIDQVQA